MSDTKEFVCIVCPASCRLTVSRQGDEVVVEGNTCKRGREHGISEFTRPMRMLTTTVAVRGGTLPRLPVISTGELPKEKLPECLAAVYQTVTEAPVACGQVLVADLCGTGVDIVASRTMGRGEAQL